MSLYGLAMSSPTPYLACKHGFSDRQGYMQCDKCPCASECEMRVYKNFEAEGDKIQREYYETTQKMRRKSIEYRATYYIYDGVWFSDEKFAQRKKNKSLKNIPVKGFCIDGAAEHPKFWQCDSCAELPTCEIGQYRQKKFPPPPKINWSAEVKKFFDKIFGR